MENLGTHSVIAGLWSSVYSLGEVLGPVLGGTLMEHYNFPVTSTSFSILNLTMAIVGTIFFAKRRKSVQISNNSNSAAVAIAVVDNDVKKEIYSNDHFELAVTVEKAVKNGLNVVNKN